MKCIIDGCTKEGVHNIGIRCRRPDTTAIWAPNTCAYLCDEHAEQGCIIDILITPTLDGKIQTNVKSSCRKTASRIMTITHDAKK